MSLNGIIMHHFLNNSLLFTEKYGICNGNAKNLKGWRLFIGSFFRPRNFPIRTTAVIMGNISEPIIEHKLQFLYHDSVFFMAIFG